MFNSQNTTLRLWVNRFIIPAVFVFIWSAGFVVARYAMPHSPPMSFLAVRFFCSLIQRIFLGTGLTRLGALDVAAGGQGAQPAHRQARLDDRPAADDRRGRAAARRRRPARRRRDGWGCRPRVRRDATRRSVWRWRRSARRSIRRAG